MTAVDDRLRYRMVGEAGGGGLEEPRWQGMLKMDDVLNEGKNDMHGIWHRVAIPF